ncbi:MAG TPA: hypothetical protein VF712_00550 [Thermoleophilaceae bacterium]|jgi:hypothetical protein
MSATAVEAQRAAIRRTLGWVLIGALCVSALTAIVAVLSGDFDEDDGRTIATSVAFAIYSAVGASGASLRLRASENLRTLGLATMALSALGFLLLLPALWTEDGDTEALWRWWGVATLAAFAASHASLMTGAFRDTDSDVVRALGWSSIALATFDSTLGVLAIAEAFEDVDESFAQLVAVLVILMLLTTALTPIVRRLQPARAAQPRAAQDGDRPPAPLAAEVIAAADRIEALNADPGNRAPEIRREVERLRALARSYERG